MGKKPTPIDKAKMELVGLYESPTADDVERINTDIERHNNRNQHKKNIAEGFHVVGMYDKDTSEEEKARILAKASLNREPTAEEVKVMLESMSKADKEYAKRKAKRDEQKKEKVRIKSLLAKQGIDYKDFVGREDSIDTEAVTIAENAYNGTPPSDEAYKIAQYIKREIKQADQRKGQRERRKARKKKE